jgi:hypothetical protein
MQGCLGRFLKGRAEALLRRPVPSAVCPEILDSGRIEQVPRYTSAAEPGTRGRRFHFAERARQMKGHDLR